MNWSGVRIEVVNLLLEDWQQHPLLMQQDTLN